MSKWDITWRDGFIEGYRGTDSNDEAVDEIEAILSRENPIEIKVTKR